MGALVADGHGDDAGMNALARSGVRLGDFGAARPRVRLAGGILLVGVGYWLLAELGSAAQYTGNLQVAWLPMGWAAAMLYLGDLRWFVGASVADFVYGLGLIPAHHTVLNPTTLQTLTNTLEFMLAALLMRRWLGRRNTLDQPADVGWLFMAIAAGTALDAAVGPLTVAWAGQASWHSYPSIVRTWWLGDTSGGLLIAPLVMVWGSTRWRWDRRRAVQGGLIISSVAALSLAVFASSHPLTYLVFPMLVLAAVSLGQRGATIGVAVAYTVAVAMTASNIGPFVEHSITDEVLNTQLYILVATLTTLTLGAAVSARRRGVVDLADSRRREAARGGEERQRIARDLHDSVSQTLFSLGLHAGIAKHEAGRAALPSGSALPGAIDEVAALAQGALLEMRASIFELGGGAVGEQGLVAALAARGAALAVRHDRDVSVEGPRERLPLDAETEELMFRIGREAITNAVKHSGSPTVAAQVTVEDGRVGLAVRDEGVGFDPSRAYPGHLGLELMRSRAADVGGAAVIESVAGAGTTVRVVVPATATVGMPRVPLAPRVTPPASVR
jgi:signal transduction histidine kinase